MALSHPVFASLRLREVKDGDTATLRGIVALAQVAYTRGDAVFLDHDDTYRRTTLPELRGMLRAGTFLVGMEGEPALLRFAQSEGEERGGERGEAGGEAGGGAGGAAPPLALPLALPLGVCVYIATSSASSTTTMSLLSIHPALQRRRLSMRVLAAAFAFAHARGYSEVESDVLACKPWLRELYEANGWRLTGETMAWPQRWMRYLKPSHAHLAPRMHLLMRHRLCADHKKSLKRNLAFQNGLECLWESK